MKRNLARIICLILVFVLLLSLIPAVFAYSGVSDWAKEQIAAMDDLGLIPDSLSDADMSKQISRLDMCRTAVLAFEKCSGAEIPMPAEHPFSDTTDPAAEKAFAAKLVSGDGDGTFRPDDSLTRLEFFCFAATLLKQLSYPIAESDYADLKNFSDAASIPQWGLDSTRLTVGLGIVAGTGNRLDWNSFTSRQEALCMFYQTCLLANAESGNSQQPSEPSEPSEPTEPEAPSEPVPETGLIGLSDWAEEPVLAMDSLGLIPESVKKEPMDGIITRQNMCKVAMLAYKELMQVTDEDLGDPGKSPFTDTDDRDVLNAYRLGIVSGTGSNTFSPESPISRQDFFTISVSFLNAIGFPDRDDSSVDLEIFRDAKEIAGYAAPPTRLLVSLCSLSGSNHCIYPRTSIVSQEALCIFYQIHEFYTDWIAGHEPQFPDASEEGKAVVETAKQYLGCPYTYGGKSPEEGFDCSGFVYYVFKQHGITLNPGATNQWNTLPEATIPREKMLPGDLVFFSDNGDVSGMTHVGIYIGDGQMIHAGSESTGVLITDLSEPYYDSRYLAAKRPF